MYDVIVVGAGPVGCRVASLLADSCEVLLIEEHKQIGLPAKCAGLVSWRIKKLVSLPEGLILNEITTAKFLSPSGKYFKLSSKRPMYAIDRVGLDKLLFRQALDAGISIKTEWFMKFELRHDFLEVYTNKQKYKAKLLIGADGALSRVAEVAGLRQPANSFYGLQATCLGSFEKNTVELWFGSRIAPSFFGWVVPLNEQIARVGLATNENPKHHFAKFLKLRVGRVVEPDTAGMIRVGLMKRTVSDRLMLVGDAACQVKPFSGGGIVYGLTCAELSALAARLALKEEEYSKVFLKREYEDRWKTEVGKAIKRGLSYRRILYAFSDTWIDFLFWIVKNFGIGFLENFDVDLLE